MINSIYEIKKIISKNTNIAYHSENAKFVFINGIKVNLPIEKERLKKLLRVYLVTQNL